MLGQYAAAGQQTFVHSCYSSKTKAQATLPGCGSHRINMAVQQRLEHKAAAKRQVKVIKAHKHLVNTGGIQPRFQRMQGASSFKQRDKRQAPTHRVSKGQIALDDRGLVGRVTELGGRSARVLLLTDMNSRVPVILENSRARAILAGTNGPRPRLMYWPEGVQPAEGERVVTSAEANAFPAGLPVGVVRYSASNVPEVQPLARLDRLEVVRLFDYGLKGVVSPEASVA